MTDRDVSAADPTLCTASTPEMLMIAHLSLAEAVARRFFAPNVRRDEDLIQVAFIGLLNASRRFDPERGVSFAAFAVPTISGEIKRHLRDHGWFIRPPRQIQDLRARISEAGPRLAQELGRDPSMAELSEDLGVAAELAREALASAQHLHPASLDAPVREDGSATLADLIPGREDEQEHAERWALLWSVLRTLPPRERRVLQLRFFEERTQQEIATEIGVSQMQVSRILAKTLRVLQDRIVNGTGAAQADRAQAPLPRTA